MTTSEEHHPDSPLIDGAIPRTPQERVSLLMAYAFAQLAERDNNEDLVDKYVTHDVDYMDHEGNEDYEWHELEDEVMELINEILPDEWMIVLHPDDPGTVVIWPTNEEEDE